MELASAGCCSAGLKWFIRWLKESRAGLPAPLGHPVLFRLCFAILTRASLTIPPLSSPPLLPLINPIGIASLTVARKKKVRRYSVISSVSRLLLKAEKLLH